MLQVVCARAVTISLTRETTFSLSPLASQLRRKPCRPAAGAPIYHLYMRSYPICTTRRLEARSPPHLCPGAAYEAASAPGARMGGSP